MNVFIKLYLTHVNLRGIVLGISMANLLTHTRTLTYTFTHTLALNFFIVAIDCILKKLRLTMLIFGRQLIIHFSISCHKICIKLHSLMHSTTLWFCLLILLEIEIIKSTNLRFKLSTIVPCRLRWNCKVFVNWSDLLCIIANQFMTSKISELKILKILLHK